MLLQTQINHALNLEQRIPTFNEIITYYGPYLGLVITLVVMVLILQFFWFHKLLKAKNEEIKRLVASEQELHNRMLKMIDLEIGYKKNKSAQ